MICGCLMLPANLCKSMNTAAQPDLLTYLQAMYVLHYKNTQHSFVVVCLTVCCVLCDESLCVHAYTKKKCIYTAPAVVKGKHYRSAWPDEFEVFTMHVHTCTCNLSLGFFMEDVAVMHACLGCLGNRKLRNGLISVPYAEIMHGVPLISVGC